MRTPVYELHIRPLFRATDREHMAFSLDLWDYDSVVANADDVLARVDGAGMPPDDSGGPWPEEWIALFRRWHESGHKRLEVGTGEFTLARTPTAVTVTATGTFPGPGFEGWLQLESETDSAKTYVLYFEAPDSPGAGTPAAFTRKERYKATDTRAVFVHDSNGVHELH
ncbi:hypothetical protein [Kitasatospora sp. A2-31]|uniref:hypothetical protein n=1 Tax=Kitasatospora sp. A2-31 TaxID=2916414 RepID=UPI001EEB8E0E|nr:hypothetical protein [Kitasatospora sp. A2-31]MCG6493857.1 hypothetical protein [Kitasatospora sp. A2-31]